VEYGILKHISFPYFFTWIVRISRIRLLDEKVLYLLEAKILPILSIHVNIGGLRMSCYVQRYILLRALVPADAGCANWIAANAATLRVIRLLPDYPSSLLINSRLSQTRGSNPSYNLAEREGFDCR